MILCDCEKAVQEVVLVAVVMMMMMMEQRGVVIIAAAMCPGAHHARHGVGRRVVRGDGVLHGVLALHAPLLIPGRGLVDLLVYAAEHPVIKILKKHGKERQV